MPNSPINTWFALFPISRFDDLKIGKLVGTDKYGNKYFENNYYFYGRNRWVEYAPHIHMAYDGSQIPAEWFGWMHYKVCTTENENHNNHFIVRVIQLMQFQLNLYKSK